MHSDNCICFDCRQRGYAHTMQKRWMVMLWNTHTRRYDVHKEFVSLQQAQAFVFYNVGYIIPADELQSLTLHTEVLWDESRAIVRTMSDDPNESWQDFTIAFIEEYTR